MIVGKEYPACMFYDGSIVRRPTGNQHYIMIRQLKLFSPDKFHGTNPCRAKWSADDGYVLLINANGSVNNYPMDKPLVFVAHPAFPNKLRHLFCIDEEFCQCSAHKAHREFVEAEKCKQEKINQINEVKRLIEICEKNYNTYALNITAYQEDMTKIQTEIAKLNKQLLDLQGAEND